MEKTFWLKLETPLRKILPGLIQHLKKDPNIEDQKKPKIAWLDALVLWAKNRNII
jgi:hypothetical protein